MPTTVGGSANAGKVLKRANPGTIQDKFLVGYQGWFTCANDGPPIGEGHHGWLHWLNQPIPANGRPNTDLWPDTSAYDPSELYTVEGLKHRDGAPAKVFSSRDPRTVRRHFHWMAEHGVDGAFLQRFVGQVDPEEAGNRDERFGGTRRLRDEVGRRVREAAEAEGRVWAIMYDASGVPASSIERIITQDFTHLLHDEHILSSPSYLHERGRPVVALWGFGLSDSPVPPHTARAVFAALRSLLPNIYIFAGVPSHWRTPGEGDAHGDPGWKGVWLGGEGGEGMVDALSPWSVGRYSTSEEVERWAADRWGGDAELVAKHNEGVEFGNGGRKVDYLPVVLPGGSGFNLSEGKWAFNGIKRNGGKFLWSQIFHAKRLKGVRSMYGAMWDEYDEGTAFLPVIEKKRLLPESENWPFLALDEDGYDLASDWYMRIAGFAAEGLRSERRIHDTFPSKELQDYWGSRPRYEDEASLSAGSSSSSTSTSTSTSASTYTTYPVDVKTGPAPSSLAYTAPAAAIGKLAAEKRAEETESERAAREAKAQFEAWSEEQRRKEAEGEGEAPPAYSLEDEGPGPEVQAPAPVQQQPVQQQAPVQQQQAPTQQQQQQQSNYGADAAVGALAGDFARTHIGATTTPTHTPPPLHPAHPGRQYSGGVGAGAAQGQGYGRGGGANLGERPPLHPTHPQAGRVGSGSTESVPSVGGSGYGAGPRVSSPEVQGQGQGQGQWGARPGAYQQQQSTGGYQQAQHTGGSAGAGGTYPAQGPPAQGAYQQHQNTGGAGAYPPQAQGPQAQWQQQQNTGVGGQGYQQAQHTGGSAGSSGSAYPAQHQQYAQTPQHTGGGGSGSSAYPAQAAPHQQYAQYAQTPQHTGGSGSGGAYPAQGQGAYQQPQHTGGSGPSVGGSYPAQGGSQYQPQAYQQQQQHTGGSGSSYAPQQQPQHTGGSGSSVSSYAPPQPPRPASAYPGQGGPNSYPAQAGPGYASGSGLGRGSSLSARPTSSMYPGAASPPQGLSPRPDSAPRPTTPGYASYPAGGGANYPASPPPHGGPPPGQHASLAPRPESVRPTTPGYGGQPQQASYSNQYPSHNPNGPPASYPGSSYNLPASIPSPEMPGPGFPPGPMGTQYAPYHPPPHAQSPPHQSSGPFPGQSFPTPQQGGYPAGPPPPGSPPYPPSFPQSGSDPNYFYQQPQAFPGAGYSPQPDMYNYAQQPQGQWVPGGGPPPMPYRPGSQPQPAYGQQPYGAPSFPTAAPPSTNPLGFPLNSLDKIVGRRTREQLEGTVDTLAQSSSKLLNKFR
ncbi:hypothetical protein B0H19DRAFT_1256870 [Mycena capillaripes]|nr:hypothetical protein B0H19DRAFT_1256870 [Mycena capillaripes]